MERIKEKTGGFLAEFRKFIARGNVMDLAVGVIIGGAFKGITDSLVADILNPILGVFAGDNEALAAMAVQLPGGGALMIGNFINAVLSFIIMAFVVFCIVKIFNHIHKSEAIFGIIVITTQKIRIGSGFNQHFCDLNACVLVSASYQCRISHTVNNVRVCSMFQQILNHGNMTELNGFM